MTPGWWTWLGRLFSGVTRTAHDEREAGPREARGESEGPRGDVARPPGKAERTAGRGSLAKPETSAAAQDLTESWADRGRSRVSPVKRTPAGDEPEEHGDGARGFSPKAVIDRGPRRYSIAEADSATRTRLRELPMIYILFLAMATFWRWVILGDEGHFLHCVDATVILALGGLVAYS